MAQRPEIKGAPEKEQKGDKKKAGLLARLFGGGGGSGAVGAGSLGGAEGGGLGGFFGSGVLATKTGLLALILAGLTAAGGLGLIGYHLLGSGSGSDRTGGGNAPLFAQRPKEAASPEVPPVPADGSSQSLKFLSQANSDPGVAADAASGAPKDPAAAGAAAPADAIAAGPSAAEAAAGGVGKGSLKAPKIGTLTGPGGGAPGKGAANSGSAAAGAKSDSPALDPAARAGTLGAMKKGVASSAGVNSHGRGFGSQAAAQQAFGAMHDNRSAASSAAGGTTYDGSAAAGSNAGAQAGIGGPAGAADGASEPTNLPNTAATNSALTSPPTPAAAEAAPWQNAIRTAQALIALASALMLVAALLSKTGYGHILAMIVAAVVAAMGTMVIALGAQIANGQYGQKLQGGVLAAAGLGLMVAAAATAFGGGTNANSSGLNTSGDLDDADDVDDVGDTGGGGGGSGNGGSGGGAGGSSGGAGSAIANINPFVLIGGGVGLIGLAGSMMMPPTKYPSSDFQNGNPPDTHWFGSRESPSETELKKMVA